jgi:hypothetical protein
MQGWRVCDSCVRKCAMASQLRVACMDFEPLPGVQHLAGYLIDPKPPVPAAPPRPTPPPAPAFELSNQ